MPTMTTTDQFITIAQAAQLADRSKTVIRRWISEGWLEKALVVPGRNGVWLLDRADFETKLPELLAEMARRKGGRGKKATDANGNLRATDEQ